MPSYTLELELFGTYVTDIPGFEIWEDGALNSSYNISSSGTSISLNVTYGGSVPTSLEFRFNDALTEVGRSIEIRSVKINNMHVNDGNFLSMQTLTQGGIAEVDVVSSSFIFDSSEPDMAEFTVGATRTLTTSFDTVRQTWSTTDEIFDALDGRDVIYLGAGNDKVSGGAGNDIIRGGGGNDLLFGAEGDDRIYGDVGADKLYGGNGNDRIHGNDGDDEIHGGEGADRLNGQNGDDIITGGLGADKLHGGNGNDYLFGGDGNDNVIGGVGDDTLDGGAGNDLIYGGSGVDNINGGADNDILIGDGGDDIIHGDDGDDTILGRADNDSIYGGAGTDLIYGGSGNDIVDGGSGTDTIYGGAGNDTINGGAGGDTIYGDNGNIVNIMEAGTTAVTQLNSTQWHSVSFSGVIQNAVVKMFATDVNGDTFTIRVRDITNNGFEFQLDEYDYQDGSTALENISWLAVSEGTHSLDNGSIIQAGTTTATNETTTAVSFNNAFGGTPIVFTQTSSDNDLSAVATRNSTVSTTGFSTSMQEQESADGVHATEDIGWIAIEVGGTVGSGIVAGTTGDVVTHANTTVNFGGTFASAPVFLADMQTLDGGDVAVTAGASAPTTTGTTVFIDEEQSGDSEVSHTAEEVGYIALNSGLYTTVDAFAGSDIIRGGDGNDLLYADIVEDVSVAGIDSINPLSADILDDNPLAYWKLDETSGATFDNLGSLANTVDGSGVNTPTLGAAALYLGGGTSVDFNGTNQGILIPDSVAINTGSNYAERTTELVFNADDVTSRQVLYEEGGTTHGLSIYLDGGNVYVTGEHDGVWVDANISASVSAGTTYHVAFVFDQPNNSFEGFLDGVSMGSVTVGNALFPSHGGDIGIGYSPDGLQFHDGEGGGGYHFNGRISDVAIYDTALSAAELAAHSDVVQGVVATAGAVDDTLYGGDGFDQFFAGEGRDMFVFESASAFNDVDQINGFDISEEDAIDISDLLTGYVDGVSDLNDFVQVTTIGSDSVVAVDANGSVGGASFANVVQINDLAGLTTDALLLNNAIVA